MAKRKMTNRHYVLQTIQKTKKRIIDIWLECSPDVVDRGFEPQSDQTKGYNIGICCFSAKYAALRSKS
jgi:hypothetical protein